MRCGADLSTVRVNGRRRRQLRHELPAVAVLPTVATEIVHRYWAALLHPVQTLVGELFTGGAPAPMNEPGPPSGASPRGAKSNDRWFARVSEGRQAAVPLPERRTDRFENVAKVWSANAVSRMTIDTSSRSPRGGSPPPPRRRIAHEATDLPPRSQRAMRRTRDSTTNLPPCAVMPEAARNLKPTRA